MASVSIKKDADGKPVKDSNENPVATVTLADGTTQEVPVTANLKIVDSEGKELAVSKDGTLSPADGIPVTPPPPVPTTDPTKVGNGSLIVKFQAASDQKFGFDGVANGSGVWGRDSLTLGQTHYYVPIKSIQAGVEDYVEFSQQGSGSVKFALEINGTTTEVTPQGNRIAINIPYTGNATLYVKDDQNRVVGKLTILSYPMVTKNVVLVSLNHSSLPNVSELQKELNQAFSQGVAQVNVSTMNFQSDTYDGAIDAERDHYKYSPEMYLIVKEFKESNGSGYTDDPNTVYLFFGKSSTSTLSGVMNRKYQFGFIFQNDAKNIAHELGHGLFALEHISNDNSYGLAESDLMDYTPTGKMLYKYQWQYVQNPPSVWSVFESAEDGEYIDASKKCKVFFVHGTESYPSRWIQNKKTIPTLLKIAGCPNYDYKFEWNSPFNNDAKDRNIAANQLKAYILTKSRDNDEIIIIGHSHGGNVALQTVDKLTIIRSVRVLTIATPAYNALKTSGTKNPENPTNILNFKAHTALWNIIDGVSGGAAGDDYFQNTRTLNVEIDVSKYYNSNDYIKAHSFDVDHPESIQEAISKGLIPEIY